jgi:hypothetical protein
MTFEQPAIELAMQCLSSHPSVPSKQTHEHVWVCPRDKSGFPVGIHDRGRQFTIYHSFWHQDFEDPNKAVTCFMFGLTAAERLKVVARGNKEHRWEVETCVDGNWASIDRVGLIFFPFWRRPRIRYLQNDWIDVNELREWIDARFTADRIVEPDEHLEAERVVFRLVFGDSRCASGLSSRDDGTREHCARIVERMKELSCKSAAELRSLPEWDAVREPIDGKWASFTTYATPVRSRELLISSAR